MKCVIANDLIDYCKHWIDVYDGSDDPKDKARRDELAAVIGEIINISTDYDEDDVYNDLIPRQAVLHILSNMKHDRLIKRGEYSGEDDTILIDVAEAVKYILWLPDVFIIRAKWCKSTGMMPPEFAGRHRCSACDGFAMHDWKHHREQLTPFCPHCGAKMENGDNDL